MSVYVGTVQGLPNPANPQAMGLASTPIGADFLGYGGITWLGTVTTPSQYGSGGGWNYTQIVTPSRTVQFPSGPDAFTYNGYQVLDTTFGYEPIYPNLYPADGNVQKQGDSPSQSFPSNATSVQVADSFVTYSLYQAPGPGSCLVPLKNWNWYWAGQAQPNSSNVWQLSNTNAQWSFLEDFPQHPTWNNNVTSGHFRYNMTFPITF